MLIVIAQHDSIYAAHMFPQNTTQQQRTTNTKIKRKQIAPLFVCMRPRVCATPPPIQQTPPAIKLQYNTTRTHTGIMYLYTIRWLREQCVHAQCTTHAARALRRPHDTMRPGLFLRSLYSGNKYYGPSYSALCVVFREGCIHVRMRRNPCIIVVIMYNFNKESQPESCMSTGRRRRRRRVGVCCWRSHTGSICMLNRRVASGTTLCFVE